MKITIVMGVADMSGGAKVIALYADRLRRRGHDVFVVSSGPPPIPWRVRLRTLVRERRWVLALVFGLIHGLGFAAVLADLGLGAGHLLEALLGFNLGVELGQLAIVAVVMPAAFLIRATAFYRRIALPAGAAAIGCLATYWAVTRAFPVMVVSTGLPASP